MGCGVMAGGWLILCFSRSAQDESYCGLTGASIAFVPKTFTLLTEVASVAKVATAQHSIQDREDGLPREA